MVLVTLFLVVVAIVCFFWWHVQYRYSYFRRRKIPFLPPKFPEGNFQGTASNLDLVHWVRDSYLRFCGRNKLFGYFFGTSACIMITDMDLVQDILVRDFQHFTTAHTDSGDTLTANIFTMEGEQWRTIRTKLSPVFSAMNTRTVLTSLRDVSADLVTYVDQFANNDDQQAPRPINVRDLFMRFINDTISTSIFGLDTGALRNEQHPLMTIGERMFQVRNKREMFFTFFFASYFDILKYLPIPLLPTEISKYFIGSMDEAMRARADEDAPKSDLLDLLMRIERAGCLTDDETGEVLGKITHNQLLGHAFLTFVLGFMTSRVALNFALYEIAKSEQIQTKLREDILAAIPADQEVQYDALESITYLQQVVDETLRKHAPAPWIERKAIKDYKVKDTPYVIEKGMRVIISTIGMHNDPRIYSEPAEFHPNRMTAEKIRRRHPCSFMPFGIGPKGCLAQRLGYLYIKLGLVQLLRKFRFSINEQTTGNIKSTPWSQDLMSTTEIWLNVERWTPTPEDIPRG